MPHNFKRRAALALFGASIGSAARAQPARRDANPPTIVIVGAGPTNLAPQGLLQGLEEHGLVQGRDCAIRYVNELELVTILNEGLVAIIVALGSRGVRAARAATSTIPIVCVDLESEPIRDGLAARFSRPGGNLTGMFLDQPTVASKWVQFLTDAVPAVDSVAVLRQPGLAPSQWRAVEAAALNRLRLLPFDFEAATLEQAFAALIRSEVSGLIILSSPLVVTKRMELARLAAEAGLPSITMFRVYAEAGGLLSYGPDPHAMGHRAASYVVRVLRGAAAGDLPLEQPSRFELAINLKTARHLGIKMPTWLLANADVLFE